jgi:hypothetical protein
MKAYWLSVKDYFSDPIRRASRKLRFVKARDSFSLSAKDVLRKLALPNDGGLYLGATPKRETVFTDLLPVKQFPERFYHAHTHFSSRKEALDFLFESTKGPGSDVWRGFTINNSTVYSFYDLSGSRWKEIAEEGTVESDLTFEWSMTSDPNRKRLFVELLNVTLQDQLREDDIYFSNMDKFYFHRASDDLSDRSRRYPPRPLQDEATRAWNIFSALYYKAGGTPWRLVRDHDGQQKSFVGQAVAISEGLFSLGAH